MKPQNLIFLKLNSLVLIARRQDVFWNIDYSFLTNIFQGSPTSLAYFLLPFFKAAAWLEAGNKEAGM